ncbi:Uncharacterised protein [Streptococcus pneumoniae]|nr:Uncharacterised protein [Streptococcus pneumoniae]
MSYDLEILAKIESGDYICIAEPRYSSPTYNLGKMFRVAMDWDFDQGTIYNVADNGLKKPLITILIKTIFAIQVTF